MNDENDKRSNSSFCEVERHDVKIIIEKEKRAIFHNLKSIAIDNNGTIFGGMVRDEIISDHYKKKFNEFVAKDKENISFSTAFWDTTINPESSARTLVPNDMDVYFSSKNDADIFIGKVDAMPFDDVSIQDLETSTNYTNEKIILKKLKIKYYLGRTFTYKGKLIEVNIDCLYLPEFPIASKNIEPPFNNLDFLCNAFIRTKDGVRLSKNTGTGVDKMNTLDRAQVTVGIMKQIVNFETEIATYKISNSHEYTIVSRSLKMIERKNGPSWNITNLPFSFEKITNEDIANEASCIICLDELSVENKMKVVVKAENTEGKIINSCQMHCKCMTKSLSHQLKNYNGKFLCPYKSRLRFLGNFPDYGKFLM